MQQTKPPRGACAPRAHSRTGGFAADPQCWTDLLQGPRNGRVGPALPCTNSRCMSRAAVTDRAHRLLVVPCLARLRSENGPALQRGAKSLHQPALPLLRLQARRSSATRLLSLPGRRGQEATEGVALQRRLCLAPASHGGCTGPPTWRRRYHVRGGRAERVLAGQANNTRRNNGAVQQGDEADEAKHIGASQLIPSVRRTCGGSTG